jgi:hypothetical protein
MMCFQSKSSFQHREDRGAHLFRTNRPLWLGLNVESMCRKPIWSANKAKIRQKTISTHIVEGSAQQHSRRDIDCDKPSTGVRPQRRFGSAGYVWLDRNDFESLGSDGQGK